MSMGSAKDAKDAKEAEEQHLNVGRIKRRQARIRHSQIANG